MAILATKWNFERSLLLSLLFCLILLCPIHLLSDEKPVLKLESYVDGLTTLYPGQRTKVYYRFSYSGNIDLQKEDLPLLEAKNFIKIGKKKVSEGFLEDVKIREIGQIIEADSPGTYIFSHSFIEGKAYKVLGGNKVYYGNTLRSLAPEIILTVKAFPKVNKPSTFSGLVGTGMDMDVSLITPTPVKVGSKIVLKVTFSGSVQDWGKVALPEEGWPGFSGFLNPFPASWVVERNTKSFFIELYPMSYHLQEIPSVEYSYFDPTIEKYIILKSEPIPFEIGD